MKILFFWTGVTSYMADCWRHLQTEPGIELKVIVETAASGKAFAAAQTLHDLDCVLAGKGQDVAGFEAFAPDVLFVGGWRSKGTRAVLARYPGVPRVFCLDMPWRWSFRCFAARFALRGFLKQFDAIYVPGKSAAFYARWLGFPKDHIYRKLYAVDQARLLAGRTRAAENARTGFLFMGRFDPEKRVDLIERAYVRYRELGGSWSIDYYGQGGKFVQASEVPRVYAEHACLVLASSFDPWPLVMLESRSAGLEVIASDRCGNGDELGAHKVPFGDVEAMARKMLEVERGAKVERPADLCDYDCMVWAKRTAEMAKELVGRDVCYGMKKVDRLLHAQGFVAADEVWVHGMWTPDKWMKCLRAKWAGKKLVRMTHGGLSPVYLKYQSPIRKKLVSPIERWLFAKCDRVAVTCAAEKGWCESWGLKNKIEIVDLKQFFKFEVSPHPFGRTSQASCGNSALHVLYLGRPHVLKGTKYLEQAVRELKGVELRMVSDHHGEELEKDWEWCDVLVLPTLSDNFGLVVAEALERGKRVITTDGAPAWEDQLGVIYLRGYCDSSDETRVKMLKDALHECLDS